MTTSSSHFSHSSVLVLLRIGIVLLPFLSVILDIFIMMSSHGRRRKVKFSEQDYAAISHVRSHSGNVMMMMMMMMNIHRHPHQRC
jgi:hypothetical protein